jgi:Zn-finger nucleic acid-binding protein
MVTDRSHFHDAEKHHTRLRCPKDGQLMERAVVGGVGGSGDTGVSVDRCARCGALWLDKGEMERVLSLGAAASTDLGPFGADKPRSGPVAPLLCPRDGSVLVEVADKTQPHVLIMWCTECAGKLLDAGELLDLSQHTLGERLRAALRLGSEPRR